MSFPLPHLPVRAISNKQGWPHGRPQAGLLTFPRLPYLPESSSVALYKQTFKEGLQLQEQFRILTGFPYIRQHRPPDCLFSAAKVQLFLRFKHIFRIFFLPLRYETSFYDSGSHQWLWQNNDCQRADGALLEEGVLRTTLQMWSRLYRHEVPYSRLSPSLD